MFCESIGPFINESAIKRLNDPNLDYYIKVIQTRLQSRCRIFTLFISLMTKFINNGNVIRQSMYIYVVVMGLVGLRNSYPRRVIPTDLTVWFKYIFKGSGSAPFVRNDLEYLNVSLSGGCCWIKCHFCMNNCFRLGTVRVGRYSVLVFGCVWP